MQIKYFLPFLAATALAAPAPEAQAEDFDSAIEARETRCTGNQFCCDGSLNLNFLFIEKIGTGKCVPYYPNQRGQSCRRSVVCCPNGNLPPSKGDVVCTK